MDSKETITADDRIFTIRGTQVILDRDLAELYGVETKRLNQQANRNIKRFPTSFRFQISAEERDELVAKCNRFGTMKHSSSLPYVFTEQGVAMLSAVLHTPTAVDISVKIMDAFVLMRRFLASNAQVFQRLDRIEYKLLDSDHKFWRSDRPDPSPEGIYLSGECPLRTYMPLPGRRGSSRAQGFLWQSREILLSL
jgi:hypothetical protein